MERTEWQSTWEEDERISVLLVDDHQTFLDGMVARLEAQRGEFRVVGAVKSVREALQIVTESPPDVVLLDLKVLSGQRSVEEPRIEAGLEAIRAMRQLSPSTKIVVLSAYHRPEHVAQAMESGAIGYVLKSRSSGEVLESVRQAHAGQVSLHPEIAQELLKYLQRQEETEDKVDPLTPREREVLQLIADGKTNQEIANELQISLGTVKKHITNIFDKLHLRSRVEAALYWRSHKHMELPE
ncbi:MAG: LuxR C-terminal-related transcriptional regulator [Anaerolineae bacterium]